MVVVDVMGKPCPIPVIEAKKAIAALPVEGGQVLVKVDNDVACRNLERMSQDSGASYRCTQVGEAAWEVVISVESGAQPAAEAPKPFETPSPAPAGGELVVAVGSERMGVGSGELGGILIKGFLYALRELEELPACVLFYNSGAFLTDEDSSSLEDLRALEERGVRILTCGTCVNYYNLKTAVGAVCNMYDIVSTMAGAARLVKP